MKNIVTIAKRWFRSTDIPVRSSVNDQPGESSSNAAAVSIAPPNRDGVAQASSPASSRTVPVQESGSETPPELAAGTAALPQTAAVQAARSSSWFLISAGAILAFAGTNHILDTFLNSQMLDLNDPILGFPFCAELLAFGIAELVVAWLCLFTNKRNLSLGLVAWLALNFAAYRIGLYTVGWPHPWVFVGGLTDSLNISPLLADTILAAICAFLLIGSGIVLWFGRIGRAASVPAATLKMSCPSCGSHVRFLADNTGRQISCPHCQAAVTLRKPEENLKISCYFCNGHIEFPPHAVGQKLKCPHCHNDITLKEPATA